MAMRVDHAPRTPQTLPYSPGCIAGLRLSARSGSPARLATSPPCKTIRPWPLRRARTPVARSRSLATRGPRPPRRPHNNRPGAHIAASFVECLCVLEGIVGRNPYRAGASGAPPPTKAQSSILRHSHSSPRSSRLFMPWARPISASTSGSFSRARTR
jgi:hypothetical protein